MFVSVEVQDEERPTRPALLRSSTSHTPYSKDTSGVLPLLLQQVNVNGIVNYLRGVREAPFIVLIGRFLGEIKAGTLITAF